MSLSLKQQLALAQDFNAALSKVNPDALGRLQARLRDVRNNHGDEVEQFRELIISARAEPEINAAAIATGLGDVAAMNATHITGPVGEVVQVFNALIETVWENLERPRFRKVIYTRDDLEPVK